MKLIEKIEIKNFRSFFGTKVNDKAEILEITDLNVFSGSNDSGKSNILRALNLFFNGKIDNNHSFNFELDFNVFKKTLTQKVIEIKIYFIVRKNRKFTISKFYDRNGYRNFEYRFIYQNEEIIIDSRADKNKKRYKDNEEILKKENGFRRYAIRFISSISFSYVPAIREERFFSQLYGRIISKIKQNEEKKVSSLQIEKRKIKKWERTIKNKSEKAEFLKNIQNDNWRNKREIEIDEKIKKISNLENSIKSLENQINKFSANLFASTVFLPAEFKVGSNLVDFFESFEISTGNNKNISLRLRGDGIQAKFIPEMLNFLDLISDSKRYFIWGFEEPENSSEYKNQKKLASKFKKFSETRNKQIFITTHSEEFLSIYDGKDIEKDKRKANLYHVKKSSNNNININDFSIVKLFDVEEETFNFGSTKSDIEDDIGSSLIRAIYSKDIKRKELTFLEEKIKYEEEIQGLKKEIEKSKKSLVFVEGKWDKVYLEKAWNVLYPNKIRPFDILQKNGRVIISEISNYTESSMSKRLFAIFDNDHNGFNYFNLRRMELCKNFHQYDNKDYLKKHKEKDVWIYLLQAPDSRKNWVDESIDLRILEMEHYFEDSFLKALGLRIPKTLTRTAKEWRVSDNFKKKLGEKINNLESHFLKPKYFINFKALFEQIIKCLSN